MAEKNYTVDLSGVTTKEQLHAALKEGLSLPDYYGGNLDALHDCLGELAASGTPEDPVTITFTGYKTAKKALVSDFYSFRNVLEDMAEEADNLSIAWRRRK